MSKQEVIQGLEKLKNEAIEANEFTPYQGEFEKDIKTLERAIEIIEKCMIEKGTAHENLIDLVYARE